MKREKYMQTQLNKTLKEIESGVDKKNPIQKVLLLLFFRSQNKVIFNFTESAFPARSVLAFSRSQHDKDESVTEQ